MSEERLVIVCVGDAQTEQWLASNLESNCVYRAEELLPALGMVITYMPDIVILDARIAPELARQVYYHLRTIDAEPILILDHTDAGWDIPPYGTIRVLTEPLNLLEEIGRLTLTTMSEGAYYD